MFQLTTIHPLTVILISGLLIASPCPFAATDTSTQLNDLKIKIHRISQELNRLRNKKNKMELQLHKLEQRIAKIDKSIHSLKSQIQTVGQRRQTLEASLNRQRKQLAQHKYQLGGQLRLTYALGRQAPVQLLMHLDDPTLVSRIMTFHHYLNRARVKKIAATQRQLEQILTLSRELEENERHLESLRNQQEQELKRLAKLREQRHRVLAGIQTKLADTHAHLSRLNQDERRLKRLLDSVTIASEKVTFPQPGHRPFKKMRGRLHWPVAGRLQVRFGAPRGAGRWEGVVIHAPPGSPVRAIHPGRVIFSDWLRGYGQIIIIRHDHDFMTLYAFNQTLLKEVGDVVKAGDVIATVGDSGGRSEPGLYFSIRYHGDPVNPLKWCRRPRKNQVS